MSEFRGRGRGFRGGRSRGGPPSRGSYRGSRGGYGDRESSRGFSRGRGGYSRGRGGPIRHFDRDEEHSPPPPRKVPMMSRGYDSDRGPPPSRRIDRYEDSYDRPPPRSRDTYSSIPPRESTRLIDRLTPPPRSSFRERDYGSSRDYPSSRGDYLPPPRSYSPPPRESFSMRDSFREDRRDTFSRTSPRDYPSSRMTSSDYDLDRSRDFRDSYKDYSNSRDYPPPRSSDFRDSLNGRSEYRERLSTRDFDNDRDHHHRSYDRPERDYGSSRFSSRMDDRPRGPPREYRGRGGFRGSLRGRDDRGGRYISGGRGRGPPRGGSRGRSDFRDRERRSPPSSRDGPPRKTARMDSGEGYSSRR